MNTGFLLLSGIVAGVAGMLVPRLRRKQRSAAKGHRFTALQKELAPFVDFGR